MKKKFHALTAFRKNDRVVIFCLAVALVILFTLPAFAGIQVETTDLGTLGSLISEAYGINNAGQIVGESTVMDQPTHMDTFHAFLWENGVMNDLGTMPYNGPGPASSSAAAINDAGQIVGWSIEPFLLQDGIMTGLGSLGGPGGFGKDINELGQIVGGSDLNGLPFYTYHAFLWQNGTMIDLGTLGGDRSEAEAININGQVAGWSTTADGEVHAFFWENGKMTDLGTLGGAMSEAHGINDKGQIVGFSRNKSGMLRAFLWEKGAMKDLDTANPEFPGAAYDINNSGQIVGTSAGFATLWQYGVRNQLDTWEQVWGSTAYHINDKGQIVGYQEKGWSMSHHRAVLWTIKGPLEQLRSLAVLVSGSDLPEGMERSLLTMVNKALSALETENLGEACGNLAGFVHETNARSKALSADLAGSMLSSAKNVQDSLACKQ